MSLIRLNNVTVRYGETLILRDAFFKLATGDRVGLIGHNGTGKTTLIKLALTAAGRDDAGEMVPEEGKVEIAPGLKLGYFSQFSSLRSDKSAREILESVCEQPRAIEAELETIAAQFEADGADFDKLLARQAELFETMETIDGWNWRVDVDTALGKLGFSDDSAGKPIAQLSGGWQNRAALAKILLEKPDALLLDEPTNYLDVNGVTWLEEWLRSFRGAVLLVSHDREFLDRVVTRIVEIENHRLHDYAGSYSTYVREKPFRLKTSARQFLHEEELLILEAEAIDDAKAWRKDPSDALRRKMADVKKRATPRPAQVLVTEIYEGLRARANLLRVEEIGKGYDGRTLFSGLTFDIHAGDRLGIVGKNGGGKSTLLRVLAGDEAPDIGKVSREGGISLANFNRILDELPPKETLSHAVNTFGMAFHAPRKQVHRFLEMLRFSEVEMQTRLGNLSGGQRARVALAQSLLSGAPLIVLDEPTNHLDVPSIQVMEQALVQFPGAAIVVSHDRFFLDRVATRLLVFDGAGNVEPFSGNWSEWAAGRY